MKVGKSIFTKLFISFIVFAFAIVGTFIISLIATAVLIGGGDVNTLSPYMLVNENGEVTEKATMEKLGCWVEELNEKNEVIAVQGDKMTPNESYSGQELLELVSSFHDGEYIGFYIEKGERRYLCIYPKEVMQVNATVVLNYVDGKEPFFFLALFVAILLSEILLLSIFLRHKIKKPLTAIVDGMERLKNGDDSARIALKTEAEFQNIVDTFNLMAGKLQDEKKEKHLMQERKNRLLLELSHDIKTPISTIKSYANALDAGLVPEEKKKEYYRTIDKKSDRVRLIADDMFTMLKMDNPEYVINRSEVELCEFLRRICAEYYEEISGDGFDFEIDIPEGEIAVSLDRNLFARVLGNLLMNARKYNQTGEMIGVSLRVVDGKRIIRVYDDGERIEDDFAKEMFQPFRRGAEERSSDGGTGLGLAIARLITEKHDGSLQYRYESCHNVFEIVV